MARKAAKKKPDMDELALKSALKKARGLACRDPDHPGNSPAHHTGKTCIREGCDEPAGTAWGPYWCMKHNVERMDQISSALDTMIEKAKFNELVDKAVGQWRQLCEQLLKERNAILRAAGGKVTVTKEQLERDVMHWSHQSHKDGSQTYQVD